jgi:hypothetical protein
MHWMLTSVLATTAAQIDPQRTTSLQRTELGEAIAPVGDLDGGGVPELAVALETGSMLVAGETGAILWRSEARASSFVAIPDQDGDGVRELLAAWIELAVVSGANGAVLRRIGVGTMFQSGLFVDVLGDVDSDGSLDVLVEAEGFVRRVSLDESRRRVELRAKQFETDSRTAIAIGGPGAGARHEVVILDGWQNFGPPFSSLTLRLESATTRASEPLFVLEGGDLPPGWAGGDPWDYRGHELARVDDVDGDGRDDAVVGTFGGRVDVVSTRAGKRLTRLASPALLSDDASFAGSTACIGDVDGDGAPEVALGERDSARWSVAVYSTRDGRRLGRLRHAHAGDHAHVLSAAGDVDRDGVPDVALLVPRCGSLTIVSGADLRLIRTVSPPVSARR